MKLFNLRRLLTKGTFEEGHMASDALRKALPLKEGSLDVAIHPDEYTVIDALIKDKAGKEIGSIMAGGKLGENPGISSAILKEDQRGKGIGKESYEKLAQLLGTIESDKRGMTSDVAKRIWESIGAKKDKFGKYKLGE